MTDPNSRFHLYDYSDMTSHTEMININEFEYYMWIEIPKEFSRYNELFSISQILPDRGEIYYLDKVFRSDRRPWLKVRHDFFDKDPGQHIYKFSFVDINTNDVSSLYLSYICQVDNPKNSYIYMNDVRCESDCK